jgi:hypothetical protein
VNGIAGDIFAVFNSRCAARSRVFLDARSSLIHFNEIGNGFRQQDAMVSRAERLSGRMAGTPLRRVK